MVKHKKRDSIIDVLTEVQNFIFTQPAFQTLGSMFDMGLIDLLDSNPMTEKEIMSALKSDEYTIRTFLQIGVSSKIIKENDRKFALTKKGKLFLYDDMKKAKFGYIRDVCYLGTSEMTSPFWEEKPRGLQKSYKDSTTMHPVISEFPQKMKDSRYTFVESVKK